MSALPIVTTFISTPDMVLRSYRACHRQRFVNRWVVTASCVVVGAAVAVVAALVGVDLLLWPGVALAVYGVGFFVVRERGVRKQLAPYLSGSREVTITMTDTEYRTQGPDRATSRTWSTFSSVSRVGDFWVLRLSPQAAMGLPTSALDQQETAAFVALMKKHGLH